MSTAWIVIPAALAGVLVALRWRRASIAALVRPRGPQVRDAMRAEPPSTVSAEATAEEVLNVHLGVSVHDLYAVIDHDGHAVGTLRRDDLARLPHRERQARLVGDVMRGGVLRTGEDLDRALARTALEETDRVVVVDDARLPVGTLTLGDARAAGASARSAGTTGAVATAATER